MAGLSSATNATILCKNLVKIGPVVSAENWLIEIALHVDVVVGHISSNISGCAAPILTIFSPYERALHADDRTNSTTFCHLSRDVAMATN